MPKANVHIPVDGVIALFGEPHASAEVSALLAAHGIDIKKVKVPRGETNVRFDLARTGMTIIFTTGEQLNDEGDHDFEPAALILSGVVAMVKAGKLAPHVYQGMLPFKLLAADTQAILRKKLGKPAQSDAEFAVDIWRKRDREIVARYANSQLRSLGVMLSGAE